MLKIKTETLFWSSEKIVTSSGVEMRKVNVILSDKMVDLFVSNPDLIKEVDKIGIRSNCELEIQFYLNNDNYWKCRLLHITKK